MYSFEFNSCWHQSLDAADEGPDMWATDQTLCGPDLVWVGKCLGRMVVCAQGM